MTRVESGKLRKPLHGVSVCFDLDGTLVDTAPDLVRVTNQVIAMEGLPETDWELARAAVGFGSRRLITDALDRAGHSVTESRLDTLQKRFLELYAESIDQLSRPFPGVVETLADLQKLGAELTVCTNKPGWLARPLLDALEMTDWFERIVGGDEAPASKPDPSHIFAAAGHKDTRHIIMVGDSRPDMDGAWNAGVFGVLVTYGYSFEDPKRLRADARIRTIRNLTPALLKHFSPGTSEAGT